MTPEFCKNGHPVHDSALHGRFCMMLAFNSYKYCGDPDPADPVVYPAAATAPRCPACAAVMQRAMSGDFVCDNPQCRSSPCWKPPAGDDCLAWRAYAAACLAGSLTYGHGSVLVKNGELSWADIATVADKMLEQERQRFPR